MRQKDSALWGYIGSVFAYMFVLGLRLFVWRNNDFCSFVALLGERERPNNVFVYI